MKDLRDLKDLTVVDHEQGTPVVGWSSAHWKGPDRRGEQARKVFTGSLEEAYGDLIERGLWRPDRKGPAAPGRGGGGLLPPRRAGAPRLVGKGLWRQSEGAYDDVGKGLCRPSEGAYTWQKRPRSPCTRRRRAEPAPPRSSPSSPSAGCAALPLHVLNWMDRPRSTVKSRVCRPATRRPSPPRGKSMVS
jgi:hypothetical protein